MDYARKIYEILDMIEITDENKEQIIEIQNMLENEQYELALDKIKKMKYKAKQNIEEKIEEFTKKEKEKKEEIEESLYPKELSNPNLEENFIGLLLENPQSISMYYFLYKECCFENEELFNIYKSILFTEGEKYSSEKAKEGFNFSKDSEASYELKQKLKDKVQKQAINFEKTYIELMKLFILRKAYIEMPLKELKEQIVEIIKYNLYDKMLVEEVRDAVKQVYVTNKFKKSVLNINSTNFLINGENNLTNGLKIPFNILSDVFKGIRKGETMSFAMPSNSGKSRFTIYLSSYLAFVHNKKTLIISNEMSEEKMKLCLITTIINNAEFQKIYNLKINVTESELLDLKFKPDENSNVEVDENGYIKKYNEEKQKDYIQRLIDNSIEFKKVLKVTEWLNSQINNSIYFINIIDHTNDELRKVILNYYYKEKIEYIFYDTLKADIDNIGNAEEVKKTATIFSNLAQGLNVFIGSTLQLKDSTTMPINLDVNELSASKTVKEVLDTLTMFKQITKETYNEYEYSNDELFKTSFNIKASEDPNERYYACVIDKNRAGAKPKLLFKINLAYNRWEELGYLRLKQK